LCSQKTKIKRNTFSDIEEEEEKFDKERGNRAQKRVGLLSFQYVDETKERRREGEKIDR
jgi:hypothetical protein